MQHCSLRGCIRPTHSLQPPTPPHHLQRLKRYSIVKITRMGSIITTEIKYNDRNSKPEQKHRLGTVSKAYLCVCVGGGGGWGGEVFFLNRFYVQAQILLLLFGVHVCLSEYSDSSFVYGFMRLIYGLVTMTTTT